MSVDAKCEVIATASGGGRDGKTVLADGTMFLNLLIPKELEAPVGDGANPEKLFKLHNSACVPLGIAWRGIQDEQSNDWKARLRL
jgi:lipoyl-dependent peroxiredoxin